MKKGFYVIWIILLTSSTTGWAQGGPSSASPHRTPSDTTTGYYMEINRIFIIGNRLTRDHIILRELSLKKGDIIYSKNLPEVIEKDVNKLYNLRLFNTIDIRPLELVTNKVDLLISLDERWYTFPSPIFELSDRNFNEWWQNYNHSFKRINYGLRLYQYNMRGRNETLKATLQFGFRRLIGINYRIPYIDKTQKHGLQLSYYFEETKNLPFKTVDHKRQFLSSRNIIEESNQFGLSYSYRPSFYDMHGLTFQYRNLNISDTITQLNNNYLKDDGLNQQYGSLSYYFSSDKRDYSAYPLKGRFFFTTLSRLGLGFNNDVNKTELEIGYARYKDLGKQFYLSNYLFAYASLPKEQPYNQYSALGYRKQVLRGYEVYLIEGPKYVLNKTTFKKRIFYREYRWSRGPVEQFRYIPISIYVKGYLDLGYVENYPNYQINSRYTDRMLLGSGGGIDFVSSYDVVVRFEYSFNHEGKGGFFLNVSKEF